MMQLTAVQLEYLEELKKFTRLQEEIQGEILGCRKSEEYAREQLAFLRENHLNAWHLWEDSEEGEKSTDDYEALVLHGVEIKKRLKIK